MSERTVNTSEQNRWDRLISLMEKQKSILDEFSEASGEMRSSLHGRKWPELEIALKRLEHLAGQLEAVEGKRQTVTARLVGDDQGGIENKIPKLSPDTRQRFQEVRSELKARLLTVRSRMRGISGYATSRGRLGRELMEELVPSTRGRMYDKRGRTASAGRDPLVVSRHL
jgi:ElaB/YqjD/DUF883 family membrane-anchored ribosome-binding protein